MGPWFATNSEPVKLTTKQKLLAAHENQLHTATLPSSNIVDQYVCWHKIWKAAPGLCLDKIENFLLLYFL